MAFVTEQQKQEATAMVMDGIKAAQVAEKLGVPVALIYQLKHDLKKSGKIQAKSAAPAKPKKNKKKGVMKSTDNFDQALADEIARIEGEIERLNILMNVQDKVSPSFAVALEQKIQRNTETLAILQELQN